jgi:DNA-binding MarR family transcriptional regulator
MDNSTQTETPPLYTPQKVTAGGMHSALGYLIAMTQRRLHEVLEQELQPLDLTAAQFVVIIRLFQQPGMTASDFCRILDYDPGAMKRLLDRIEHKGFIRRTRNPQDKRAVHLELTESGRQLQPEIMPKVCQAYNRLLHGFSADEAGQLEHLLQRILANSQITDIA